MASARGMVGLGTLPDAIIIGAQKCGTTSLFHYLKQHPGLGQTTTKEVHYFDLQFERGPSWYRGQFRRSPGQVVVEASPYYLFHPGVPDRVAALLPDVKLIVMMREPVARAYSHYQHACARGHERLGFEEALAREAERTDAAEDALARGAIVRSVAHQRFSYVRRGLYADQIARWRKHYDSDRFLFLRAEDMFGAPQDTFDRTCDFLGMPSFAVPDTRPPNARTYDGMPSNTRARLAAYYDEPNRKLAEMTGIHWT